MISPTDGIFGVSLDLCVNVESQGDFILFTDRSCIYEIKCRFKYLFSKSEFDPIYPSYTALYKRPCKRSFIRFINSIARPTVEYVPDGRLPSEGDYLLTQDEAWNLKDVRKRKLGPGHDLVADSLAANRGVESMLYVMTDPSENAGRIGIKDRVPVNIFINPRHNYFYQVLLQYKIVGDYVRHSGGGKPGRDCSPRVNIVTAFFRKRSPLDPATCTLGSDLLLDALCKQIQEFSGETGFCDFVSSLVQENDSQDGPSLKSIYWGLQEATDEQRTVLCSYVESMTRGQSENLMWDILRNGIISSSKLLSTIKNGPTKVFEPAPMCG